jgi:hypothetical protein
MEINDSIVQLESTQTKEDNMDVLLVKLAQILRQVNGINNDERNIGSWNAFDAWDND